MVVSPSQRIPRRWWKGWEIVGSAVSHDVWWWAGGGRVVDGLMGCGSVRAGEPAEGWLQEGALYTMAIFALLQYIFICWRCIYKKRGRPPPPCVYTLFCTQQHGFTGWEPEGVDWKERWACVVLSRPVDGAWTWGLKVLSGLEGCVHACMSARVLFSAWSTLRAMQLGSHLVWILQEMRTRDDPGLVAQSGGRSGCLHHRKSS